MVKTEKDLERYDVVEILINNYMKTVMGVLSIQDDSITDSDFGTMTE